MGSLLPGLAAHGKLIVVGVPQDQIQLNAFPLVFGGRSIYGSLTGTPIDGEDTLAFSVLENTARHRGVVQSQSRSVFAEGKHNMDEADARLVGLDNRLRNLALGLELLNAACYCG